MNQYRYLCQILYLASQVNSSHILFLDLWPPRSNILSKGQNFTFILDIRRTIEITLEPIEISSPNFMCSSNGQIYTHLIFWLLTSKLKLPIKRSKLKLFFGIWRIIEITVELIEISSTNLICTFKGQFYTHFIFRPFTSKVKLLSKGQNLLFKRSKLFFLDIRRTIEMTLQPIEISSPNFTCSFSGQFYKH